MNDTNGMLDTAIKENRLLTQEEVLTLLEDPTIQDALKNPLARFSMIAVSKFDRAKRKILALKGAYR